jgi:hypothetical protein
MTPNVACSKTGKSVFVKVSGLSLSQGFLTKKQSLALSIPAVRWSFRGHVSFTGYFGGWTFLAIMATVAFVLIMGLTRLHINQRKKEDSTIEFF